MLASEDLSGIQTITSYDEQSIHVNKTPLYGPTMLCPSLPPEPWHFDEKALLNVAHIKALLSYAPKETNVIIVGMGKGSFWLPKTVQAYCYEHHIGIEAMPTPAACRTYNLLAADHAAVVAGIMPNNAGINNNDLRTST